MSYAKRTLSALLALFTLLTACLCFARPARAMTDAELEAAINDAKADADQYYDTCYSDGKLAALAGGEVTEQELLDTGMGLLEALPDPKDTALWAVETLFSFLVPKNDPNAEVLNKLAEMMQKQDDLMAKIGEVNNSVVAASAITTINKFLDADSRGLVKTYYGALRQIDEDYKKHLITSDAAMEQRKAALTRHIPKVNAPSGALCDFDEFTYGLGSFLTTDYATAGLPMPSAKLFTIFYEWHKREDAYRREHQGYETRAFFQNCALSLYMTAASIDKLSLTARLQELPAGDQVILKQRLSDLNAQIKLVKDTVAPFAVKPRDDSERFYQVPGHEKLLYTQAYQPLIPTEPDPNKGWHVGRNSLAGLYIHNAYLTITQPFYFCFNKYQGAEQSPLIDYDWLYTVWHDDYKDSHSLLDIFFSDAEGKFTPPAGMDYTWNLVLQDVGAFALQEDNPAFGNKITIFVKTLKLDMSPEDIVLYRYYPDTNVRNEKTSFIGIGVKPQAASNAPSARTNILPTSAYENTAYAAAPAASESAGAFTVNGSAESFTGASIDGKPLQRSVDFTVEKTENGLVLRLTEAFRATLKNSAHKLRIYFTDGKAEINFNLAETDSALDVPATGSAYNGALWALFVPLLIKLARKKRACA